MEVQAVKLDVSEVQALEELYQRALSVLDADSQANIRKYYHRIDNVRGLIGRLLPRLLLHELGIAVPDMKFSKTQAGKPYITTSVDPPIGYNITHDNGIVAMVYASGKDLYPDPPAYRVGIDVMLLQLPKQDTFRSFVEVFSEQLTELEHRILLPSPALPPREQLRRFYLIWTLKEAYTKALGLGMGFDFSRIEYDVPNDAVRIDGAVPRGWEFTRFELKNEMKARTEDYVGIVARFVGDDAVSEGKVRVGLVPESLKLYDGAHFLTMAIEKLSG